MARFALAFATAAAVIATAVTASASNVAGWMPLSFASSCCAVPSGSR